MSVNIDGNFELNATFNTNGQTVTNTYIPYSYSKGGQSSFSVTGDVKISVVTIAPDAEKNSSTQAFTFTAEASSSEEAKKTVNLGNPNSTFSLFTAYFPITTTKPLQWLEPTVFMLSVQQIST